MGFKSKYTGAKLEALLDDTKPPYVIKSFTLQDLSEDSGTLKMQSGELLFGDISDALSEGRRILMRVGPEDDDFKGSIDTNAYEEDLTYLNLIVGDIAYHVEIGSRMCTYERRSIGDVARDAVEDVVKENLPTEIATAPQRELLRSAPANNAYMANIVYEWEGSPTAVYIDALEGGDDAHDNVWTIRFGCTADTRLLITPSVYWKDGAAPSFGTWGICELIFRRVSDLLGGTYLGEWKIYK